MQLDIVLDHDADCPECGEELRIDYSFPVIDTNPQIVVAECMGCDWTGMMNMKSAGNLRNGIIKRRKEDDRKMFLR